MNNPNHTLKVDLADRSYPIYIGNDLIGNPEIYRPHIHGEQVLVVSNTTVAPLYLERVVSALQGYLVESVILPDGEVYKILDEWQKIIVALLENRVDSRCTVLGLGGCLVGDVAGLHRATS